MPNNHLQPDPAQPPHLLIGRETLDKILNTLYDGLYLVDRSRQILYWNKAAERISGFTAAEAIGKHCYDNLLNHVDINGEQLCLARCPLAATIADGQPREMEIYLHHKDGHRIPVSVRATPLTDPEGNIIGAIELFSDISKQPANTLRVKELEKLALLDGLTQLANRTYLENEIRVRIAETRRLHVPFGVLFIDVDHFKKFNDTYGHSLGDEVLKSIALTMTANARPFDVYGRWGGEEFMGIIRNVDAQELVQVGNRLRALVAQAFLVRNGQRLQVTVSIGATLVGEKDRPESLVCRADALLYKSKAAGRNCLTFG